MNPNTTLNTAQQPLHTLLLHGLDVTRDYPWLFYIFANPPEPLSRCGSRPNAILLTIRNWLNPAGHFLTTPLDPIEVFGKSYDSWNQHIRSWGDPPHLHLINSSNPSIWLLCNLVLPQPLPHICPTFLTRLHQTYIYLPNHNVGTQSFPHRGGRG
jgi:hypothetical protein